MKKKADSWSDTEIYILAYETMKLLETVEKIQMILKKKRLM